MEKPRIFTFGCSFTHFIAWPTWADILKKEYNKTHEVQNWGKSGACNYYIFNSIIECDVKNQINKDDIVIVMWTSVNRESRYVSGKWITPGNIYNNNGVYPDEFVNHLADERGFALRDFSLAHAIDGFLSKIGCKYYFLSMIDLDNSQEKNQDLVKKYHKTLAKIRSSVFKTIFNEQWGNPPNVLKNHPNLRETDKQKLTKDIAQVQYEYNNIIGSNWPSFDDYYNNNLEHVKENILQEIEFIEKQKNWNRIKGKYYRFNMHPTPNEHLEYINKILPEFSVSASTVEWVNTINEKVLDCKNIDSYWVNSIIKRW